MGNEPTRVPIRELAADVDRILERVARGESVIVVDQAGEDLAIVKSVRPQPRRRRKTAADLAAFRASAGGWSDVDTDIFIETVYNTRRSAPRPPVEL